VKGVSKMGETAFDLRYNIAALCIAILREDIATPEQAFAVISESAYKLTDEDVKDMIKMKEQGMYRRKIGEIYGISPYSVDWRIERYKKRISQTAI